MKKAGFLLVAASLFVIACARPPQNFDHSLLRITYDKKDTVAPYNLKVEGRVSNQDDSIVFIDYNADVILFDGAKEILRLKASRKEIMPFSRAILYAEKKFSKDDFASFAAIYKIDIAALEKNGAAEPVYLKNDMVKLENVTAKKESILKVLKEGKK